MYIFRDIKNLIIESSNYKFLDILKTMVFIQVIIYLR